MFYTGFFCSDFLDFIDICPHCTACRQDLYWSHRKVGNARGAQIALLALEDPL